MKRTRLARGAAAPRVLRRKNVVHDEEDSEEEEEENARMSGEGAENEEDDEEEEGDEEDEEEEEEEDDDDDDEEEEEEEEQTNQTQRRRTSDRIKGTTPPPKKKLRRGPQSKREEEAEDEDGDEDDASKQGSAAGEDEGDEEEEKSDGVGRKRMPRRAAAAAVAPPRRNERPTPKRGATRRNKVDEEEEEEKDEEEEKETKKKKTDTKAKTAAAVESEEASQEREEEDTGTMSSAAATPMDVDNDDMEETKSESTPFATPSSSPVRRTGLSISTLMNSETPTKKSDRKPDEVPFQYLRDRLRSAASEPELLEVLTSACSSLIKDGKAPNRLFAVALLSAVKENASRYSQPGVLKYLLRLLRSKHYAATGKESAASSSDPHGSLKKTNSNSSILGSSTADSTTEMPLPVVIANILLHILKDAETWPEDSFKVFLDDSLHSRVWVDHEFSSAFVRNVKTMIRSPEELSRETSQASALVRPRFIEGKDRVELRELAMKHIRLRLNELEKERSAMTKVIRPMVLALIDFVSIPEARVIAAENLDTWLQNPATKGPAKDLLNKVISHCRTMEAADVRAVGLLFKLKLKPTMFQVKVETITQLVRQHEGYMRLALHLFISRERPNNMGKDVDNMKMLQQIFRASRTSATSGTAGEDTFYTVPAVHPGALPSRELGFVFRDLCSSSEVAPVLKTMVRKIIKQLAFDNVDMKTLCVEILKNDDHLDALDKYADMRLLDYTALVTGTVWLVLLMRGAAVKNLQIQQTNAATSGSRQETGTVQLGGPSKLGAAQAIPRRAIQSVVAGGAVQAVRVSKHSGAFGKSKAQVAVSGKASPSSAGGSSASSVVAGSSGALQDVASTNKAVKLAVKAKEELQQTLAHVQRQALISCHEIFHKFGLTGKSAFEKSLYESIVKKLLFLDIPPDVQPTEHDKTCFLSTKEDIPLHEDSLEMLTSLLSACESVDRVEALRTLEAIVFRAAEGHMKREDLWGAAHGADLATYSANGGVLGLEVTRTTFVLDLLRLTVWKGEHKLEHEFCHSSRFWICCTILLIVGSFNPTTVGDFLWREIPTLRAIMQMLITGRFEFPSVSTSTPDLELFGGHRENFNDLLHANSQLREYEQHVMVTVASTVEDPLMLFEVQGVARQPPPAIIDHLKVLDRKFRLGTRLRQSRTKDFLMEMVAAGAGGAETGSDGSWWITDIVCEDFDTVQYLPYECLCRLLLLAHRGSPLNAGSSKGAKKARQLAQVVPRLQFKLREFLVDPAQIDQGAKVVLYFLDCLVSGAPRDRRVASQILVDLTRDEMEVESASSTPKSESDGTLDETASSTLPTMEGVNPLDTMNATMSFEWLGALLKLPCYTQVRDNVFSALESLLDRESTVSSLSSCIKALHAFWKDACEQQQKDDAAKLSSSKARIQYSGAAADASVQLAGTFGRLLSTREFVCRHLLQQRDVCEIICEIFWSVVALQLRYDASDRSGGIRFSDCKVFYATDGTSTVREIKLPLPVIHGAIRVLCATVYSPQGGSLAYEKLSDCLFPKVKKDSSTAILSSTGVIATKDRRLYPSHLLKTMVQHSSSPHLVAAAAKATPPETLWELLRSTGLRDHALSCVTRALADLIKSNESVAMSSLQAVSKTDTIEEAAVEMERSALMAVPNTSSTDRAGEHARYLHDWIARKAESAHRKLSTVTEDEEELLSSGFTAFSVSPPISGKHAVVLTVAFDDEIEPDDLDMSLAPVPVDPVVSDWNAVVGRYPKANLPSDPSRDAPSTFVLKAVDLVLGACDQGGSHRDQRCDAARESDASSAWSRRIALLHSIRSCCHSNSGAARLGTVVTHVIEHASGCESESCATECCEFVRQACAMVGESYSQSASYWFVEQATRIADLSVPPASQKSARSLLSCLSIVLSCVDTVTTRWAKNKYTPTLSPLWLHNVVALVIEVEILARSVAARRFGCSNSADDSVMILRRIVDSLGGDDATALVFILESLLSASASIVSGRDYLAHHQDVRRELIEALYFSYPRAVSVHLDVLDPSWKWTTSPLSRARLYLKPGPAEAVAAAVADLKREGADGVDRLRELSIREPVLVQNGLLSLLQEWKGDISLTLLYQKAGVFQQIIRVADMVAPYMMSDNKAVEALLEFVFEILDTISRHQAAEFYQLVARVLAFLADALARDGGCIAEALFKPDRLESLRAVTAIYESVAEIASFGGVIEDPHNPHHVKDALAMLEAARNKTVASSEDQRLVRGFLERLEASHAVTDTSTAVEVETSLQLLLQILNKAQELGTRVPLLAHCAEAVAPLLEQPNMTKPAMKTLCQVLLALIKHDPTDAVNAIAPHYLRCLTSLRIALRECVLVYIADFLSLTDVAQRRAILERLYDDFSDVAKSKLMAFVKSPAFKISYQDHDQLS